MAEYIDRDAALREIERREALMVGDKRVSVAAMKSFIKNRPPADVAPVVHGRWIGAPICGNDNCKCSECGSWHNIHANLRGEIMQKYCPNCGAKMDGGGCDAAD